MPTPSVPFRLAPTLALAVALATAGAAAAQEWAVERLEASPRHHEWVEVPAAGSVPNGESAALVFYGTAPKDEQQIAAVAAPVHGFYGENDERVNATIPETRRLMEAHGKTYSVEIYEGAGHAFMRQADDPAGPEAAKQAKQAAWERLEAILDGVD